MTFTYASLFAGIGGFETALNRLVGRCVFASEIDKHARKAYEVLYGGDVLHGDITKINAKDVPDHDLLTAGFPCQAFSVAGNRKGFEDTRGTLFFEIARIASAKKPRALLLENVKGLVGHDKGRTLDTIVKTLNEIGYTVDFEVLNSKYFGVPQNRERIFIVAVRDDLVTPEPWKIEGNTVVPRGKRRISGYEGVKTFEFDCPAQAKVTTRLRDILETDVDEKYYLSKEKTAKLVAQLEENLPAHFPTPNDINNTIRTGGKGSLTAKHNYEYIAEPQIEQFSQGDGVSCCIDANYTKGTAPGDVGKGRRTHVVEYSRKSGVGKELDIAHTLNSSDWRGLNRNQTQNAVFEEIRPVLTPDREEKRQQGRRFKEDGEPAFTLNTQDRHGVAIGRVPRYCIRKLTPRECWRLQGFTDTQHDAVEGAGVSNSQRYKQAGNAVTVNVVEALGAKLLSYLTKECEGEAV